MVSKPSQWSDILRLLSSFTGFFRCQMPVERCVDQVVQKYASPRRHGFRALMKFRIDRNVFPHLRAIIQRHDSAVNEKVQFISWIFSGSDIYWFHGRSDRGKSDPRYRERSKGCTQEITEADAHLIAAASDLLEAAKGWINFLDSEVDGTHDYEVSLLDLMRRAIAKAEGKL